MTKIVSNKKLMLGRYYWCQNKNHPDSWTPLQVGSTTGGKFIGNRIWCSDENNQGLQMYNIFGPIDPPMKDEDEVLVASFSFPDYFVEIQMFENDTTKKSYRLYVDGRPIAEGTKDYSPSIMYQDDDFRAMLALTGFLTMDPEEMGTEVIFSKEHSEWVKTMDAQEISAFASEAEEYDQDNTDQTDEESANATYAYEYMLSSYLTNRH